jgi:predicted alpha/beta superfamily hydrolase
MFIRFLYCVFIAWGLTAFQLQAEEVTEELTIYSNIAKQDLKIHITLPSNYESKGTTRYPSFYTTSGQSRLDVLKAEIKWLSHVDFAPLPQVFFISLPAIKADKFTKASGSLYSLTTQVYEKEVIPYIERKYRTQPYRMIEGFSSNANQLLSIFTDKPQLFNAYIIFSPALGLDKSNLIEKLLTQKADNRYRYRSLYLSLGSFEENRPLFKKIQNQLETWSATNITGLEIFTEDLSNRNYLSAPIVGLTNAAENIFSDRQPDVKLFEKTGVTGVEQHFVQLNNKYGYKLDANNTLVDLGFHYAKIKQFEKAEETLNTVISKSPENIIYLVRLAEIQQQGGNNAKAKNTLKLALKHAKNQKNVEAKSYIESRMSALN